MIPDREPPLMIKLLLVGIFLVGVVAFAFVLVDAGWTRLLIVAREAAVPMRAGAGQAAPAVTPPMPVAPVVEPPSRSVPPRAAPAPDPGPSLLDGARKSIVLVAASQCPGNGSGHGTGFVIKSGYAATNAHVIANCRDIKLIDYQGNQHRAKVKGIGTPKTPLDLAILSYNDGQDPLPPLVLAEQAEGKAGEKIQTVGYPLVAVESGQNAPSPSNEGVIASYDINDRLFYSQGMNINPGNSGGPVFLLSNRKVVGVALAKSVDMQTAEGVGVFIPSAVLREFFRKRAGETLQ